MSKGLKKGAIVKWSGGRIWFKEVKSDGTDLASPDTYSLLTYLAEGSGPNKQISFDKVMDETGSKVKRLLNEVDPVIECVALQSDKDFIDFLETAMDSDKYYSVIRYEGVVDGNHQEWFVAICQISSQIDLKSGTKRIPFTLELLTPSSDVTMESDNFPSDVHAAADVTVSAGKYWTIVETAVS